MIEFTPKHIQALKCLAVDSGIETVLYGGSAGSGKSFLGCAWQIQRRLVYKGTRGLIGRSKLDALKKTTLKTFFEVAALFGLKSGTDFVFNGQSNIITFANGSEIILKDLFAYPSDVNFDRLGSLEITDWFIDEVSQVSKKAVDTVKSRVRYKLKEYNIPPIGIMTCNPSKGWLYNEIYVPHKQGTLPPYIAFIPALPHDNPHLPESYLLTLSRLPELDRRRLLEGDWEYDDATDCIFNYDDLLRCFRDVELDAKDFYITADVARLGKDRSVVCVWRGLNLIYLKTYSRTSITTLVGEIRALCNQYGVKLSNVICDEDGVGGGAVDGLACRGFLNGARAKQAERFQNLKAECYFKLAELIESNQIVFKVSDYRDQIIKELDMIRRKNPDGDGRLAVIGKEEIARFHGISPDIADAIMMRMYFELYQNYGVYSWA